MVEIPPKDLASAMDVHVSQEGRVVEADQKVVSVYRRSSGLAASSIDFNAGLAGQAVAASFFLQDGVSAEERVVSFLATKTGEYSV